MSNPYFIGIHLSSSKSYQLCLHLSNSKSYKLKFQIISTCLQYMSQKASCTVNAHECMIQLLYENSAASYDSAVLHISKFMAGIHAVLESVLIESVLVIALQLIHRHGEAEDKLHSHRSHLSCFWKRQFSVFVASAEGKRTE